MQYKRLARFRIFTWAILILTLAVSGCTNIRLIADYDETTDKAVTELQRKMSTFLIDVESKLETPDEAKHEKFAETYKEFRVDISAIELRVNAMPKNRITQNQIKALKNNIGLLESLHKTGFAANLEGKKAVLATIQKDFDVALAAILKLELAKRRGEEPQE
jgi:hypothetical protein